jgi:YVTN family beta-propeller protein
MNALFPVLPILWLALLAPAGSAGLAPASPQRFEEAGIAVEFSLAPLDTGSPGAPAAGDRARAVFRVTEAPGGRPLAGLHPLAWMTAVRGAAGGDEPACHAKARGLLEAGLANRADLDLNGYLLLALNGDKTVSFINPQVTFNQTQLESVVELPAAGAGWTLTADGSALYVTLPSIGAVAVIDTATRQRIETLSLGAATGPHRIALQPDGHYAWVALDDVGAVAVIDLETRKVAARIPTGPGEHDFAFTPDSRFAFVTNGGAGSVSAIDVAALARLADLPVGRRPVAVAYGEKSRRIYVASAEDGSVSVIDPETRRVSGRIELAPGIAALKFEPEGRFALAVNQRESTVTVIDSASGTAVASAAVPAGPDQVAFSAGYAYVRGSGSPTFTLFGLGELRQGRLSPVRVQAGAQPPGTSGPAAMIAPTPEGNSVLIANAAEKMAFYYVEGMMVPMGTLRLYGREPQGLLVLDRSLREIAPGVYATAVSLPRSGAFDVPLLIDQPRVVHCFTATVAPSPDEAKAPSVEAVEVQPLFTGTRVIAGQPARLSFRIVGAAGRQPVPGLKDVRALAFEPPGTWQQRRWARDAGDGVYQAEWVFPRPGVYQVGISVPSRGLGPAGLPFTTIRVEDPSGEKAGTR